MNPIERPHGTLRHWPTALNSALLLLIVAVTVFVYRPGLSGPFLFDDNVHIVKNSNVAIEDLSLPSLQQAWHSSLAQGVSKRPLAMLSFGINHAITGKSSVGFKTTNLILHILCGITIYLISFRLARLYGFATDQEELLRRADTIALFVAAIWLVHPLNLSTVLYVVQRMSILSTLGVTIGLLIYLIGRQRLYLERRGGRRLVVLSFIPAGIAILAKENAVLYPLLIAVIEWTLLRNLTGSDPARRFMRNVLIGIVALPLALGCLYYLTHLESFLSGYQSRGFSLEERLLTETRALWFYVKLLFFPDITQLGLHHDGFLVSKGLVQPRTTLAAVASLITLGLGSVVLAKRYPVPAFGILFFLAGHSLESSVLPLELVFEHRNYLPSIGPLFALAMGAGYLLTHTRMKNVTLLAGIIFVTLLAAVTHLRAMDWSSLIDIAFSEVEHHPDSPRANFFAAKLYISHIGKTADSDQIKDAATAHLQKLRQLSPENLNALFGLIVLNLHLDLPPEPQWISELQNRLRTGIVDPQHLSVTQFSYLVKWHMSDGKRLSQEDLLGIFNAALANPRFDRFARGGILSALRAYHLEVLNDPETAHTYARQAVDAWPERWHFHKQLVKLLVKLERWKDATEALSQARQLDKAGIHAAEATQLARLIKEKKQL